MEQAKIEQLAFLYLCSEHDKRLLLKKEKMPLADFDRLTYLIYHLGFKEYHIKAVSYTHLTLPTTPYV